MANQSVNACINVVSKYLLNAYLLCAGAYSSEENTTVPALGTLPL